MLSLARGVRERAAAAAMAGSMVWGGCWAGSAQRGSPEPVGRGQGGVDDHCDIVVAVLRETIRSPAERRAPVLERECVEDRAAVNGKIYVEARFTWRDQPEPIAEPGCERDHLIVRFGSGLSGRTPTRDVVRLDFLRTGSDTLAFEAVTDRAAGSRRRAVGEMHLSQCGSASGRVRRGPADDGWHVFVFPPRPPPNATE